MAFEELDRWLEQWAQRQRREIRETLARELMALDAAQGRLRQANQGELGRPLQESHWHDY